MRRCQDPAAREHCEELLRARLGEGLLKRRWAQTATHELLAELRQALAEKRTPDMALAATLLRLGANPRSHPHHDDDSSDDDDDPWLPRDIRDYGSLRTLDLLALNRYSDTEAVTMSIQKAIELRADPNRGRPSERPIVLAVRSRHVAAVRALLNSGAELNKHALIALRQVCLGTLRHELEDMFKEHFLEHQNESMTLQRVGLWAAVQCGFQHVATAAVGDSAVIDVGMLTALRRCRNTEAKTALDALFRMRLGEPLFRQVRAEAATNELILELREALRDKRDPDMALVQELLSLGANPQMRGSDFDDSDGGSHDSDDQVDFTTTSEEMDTSSESG